MKENIIIGAFFAFFGGAWYLGYVKPADEARLAILDCMTEGGDTSRASYDACTLPRGDK
jgi:hypothetical protein